ncbi:hypothetical protein SSS_02392 [Sarcoptes scabiei]|nr:hypothetical protein SSS_02392 [Sarcoptes scabiei]
MWKSLIVFFSLIVACSATCDPLGEAYNGSYPLTPPFVKGNEITYRWAMIADYGQRYGDKYRSEMKFGTLTINTKTLKINLISKKIKEQFKQYSLRMDLEHNLLIFPSSTVDCILVIDLLVLYMR